MALVLSNDYITPAELTGYVREALADLPQNQFGLEAYLPNTPVDDIDYHANVGGGGLSRAARFRSWDTEAGISGRKGIKSIAGALPPVSEKRRLGEYDRLKMRQLDAGIVDAVLNDAVELGIMIQTRYEIARGQALSEGRVVISENGLSLEVDFGRKASHTQTAATLWDVAGSDPIDDLLAWQAIYVETNGVRPGGAITDQGVISTLMRNQAIRDYTLPSGSTTQIVTVDAIDALLRSFGLPSLTVYEAQVEGADGNAAFILPQNRVLFTPPAGRKLGETLFGVTAEALDSDYDIDATEAPGIVVGTYSDKDPVALWTKASAVGLPIVPNTDLTLSATVK